MLQDSIKLTGRLSIQKFNDKDELIYQTEVPNLVVNSGKEYIAGRLIGSGDSMYTTGNLQIGSRYRIISLGTTTQAEWNTIAGTSGLTYAVGSRFTAAATGSAASVAVSKTNNGSAALGTALTANVFSGTIVPGMVITGSDQIPAGTTIVSGSGTSWVMSAAASGTFTNAYLQFTGKSGEALFSDAMGYMSIGDNASTVAVSQTALTNEVARVATSSLASSSTAASFSAVYPAGTGTSTSIQEAGIFNRSNSNLYTFNSIATGSGGAVNTTNKTITISSHGLSKGDKITYSVGGGTAMTNLTDGTTYYVIYIDSNTIQLATTSALAASSGTSYSTNNTNGYAIAIGAGTGNNHKIIYGTMLCRTTFPVISKSNSESLAITWTVTVG